MYRLSVLTMHFHEPRCPQWLADGLDWLKRHRKVLPLTKALACLDGRGRLPRGALSIVVDDAVDTFGKTGWPLFEQLQLPITVAVIPGLVPADSREHQIARLMRVGGHEYSLPRPEMLGRAVTWLQAGYPEHRIKGEDFDELFQVANRLPEEALLGLIEHLRCDRATSHGFMSWDELRRLRDSGLVGFAAHSMSHPVMSVVTGGWLQWELQRPIELIQERLDVQVDTFVYPYGQPGMTQAAFTEVLKASGYRNALLNSAGTIGVTTDRYHLPRCDGEDRSSFFVKATPIAAAWLYDLPRTKALAWLRRGGSFVKRGLRGTPRRSRLMFEKLWVRATYSGVKFSCPCCEGNFRRLKPFCGTFSIKGEMVNCYTPNAICPRCRSQMRNRFLLTFLRHHTSLLKSTEKQKVLHFAPEAKVASWLRDRSNIDCGFGLISFPFLSSNPPFSASSNQGACDRKP